MADKEKEIMIHALTIIKYCKEHKNCKGCMFWNNATCCPFNVSCPSKWRIYGFDSLLKDSNAIKRVELKVNSR
jgi:hypothetical protein